MRSILFSRHLLGVTLSFVALASTSLVTTSALAASSADLSIQISGPSQISSTTNTVRYSVLVKNAGPSSVFRPKFAMTVPSGGRTISVGPLQNGSCIIASNGASCTLSGSLAKGASVQVFMDVDVTMTNRTACINPSAKTPQIAKAVVLYDTTKYIDPNIVNNVSSTQFVVNCVSTNQLTVQQTAMLLTGAVVRNTKDVPLLRFKATADTESIALTSLSFDAKQGSLLNAQNYTLMVDTNNDGIVDTAVQKGVLATAGMVTFNKLTNGNFIISARQTVLFEVRGDIVSAPVSSTLQLKFATSNSSYIIAKRVLDSRTLSGIKTDGVCLSTCETTVTTSASTLWNIFAQGNLFITSSVTPVSSHQMLGGTLSDDVLRLSFRADMEDIEVTKLVVTATGSDASTLARNISSLMLFKPGSTVPFAVATIAACGTDPVPFFSMCATMNARELVVAKGASVEVIVRAQVKTDTDGAVSGKRFTFTIDAKKGANARGATSMNNLATNNGDTQATGELFIGVNAPAASRSIFGKEHVITLSKVLSIMNVDVNADGTAVPTGSSSTISQLRFSATNHSNVSFGMNTVFIDTIVYTVKVSNVNLDTSTFFLYNKADPFTKAPCTLDPASTSSILYVSCANLSTSAVDATVSAGSDVTLSLKVNVRSAPMNSSLQVSLENFFDSTRSTVSVPTSHIRWMDHDNASSVAFYWMELPQTVINGTMYKN